MSISFNSFIKLGSNRNLSKAELSQILDSLKIEQVKYQDWKDYLLLSLGKNTQKKLVKKLEKTGSIIKFGNLEFKVGVSEKKELNDNLVKIIDDIFVKYLSKRQRQLKLSLNIRTDDETQKSELSKEMRKIIRNISQEKRFPVKVLPTKKIAYELTPFDYNKENLPSRGIELNLFVIKSKIYFGPTRWVTNPFKDIKQDEERPVRFFTHGTSIKLSRTLVTLANIPFDGIMLDPFCGTGTILIEGLKQGLKVIGVDKDQKCVRSSKTNLHHFSEKYPSREKMKEKWRIHLQDSRKLTDAVKKKVDGVVTEPFLGPFFKRLPQIEEAHFIMKNLERLYTRVLAECKSLLKDGARILFIIPEYKYPLKRSVYPNIKSICEKVGLTSLEECKFFNIKFPIEIGRKHNVIARRLFIFESK